jgi:putative ABC transport system permease protein
MFDIDKWQEIFSTIKQNKLRTFLTAFSVAWGIFILIILLGSGNGLENGIRKEFRGQAVNSIWIYQGQTSKSFQGMKPGRSIQFTNEDFERTKKDVKDIEYATARSNIWDNPTITYKNEFGAFDIVNVHPNMKELEELELLKGRFINELDIKQYNKVTVISDAIKNQLFKGKNPLGEYVLVNKIPFQVVGIYKHPNERDNKKVYLPISTAQRVFNGGDHIESVAFTTNLTVKQTLVLAEKLRATFAHRHKFDVADKRAIWIQNNVENFEKFMSLFAAIRLFVWIIGIGTIIAGIVGVSNIMIIVVKDRTKEIGIRKAIGATPFSVVGLVMMESIFITALAGFIGLLFGVGVLEAVAPVFKGSGSFFLNPSVDFRVGISATLVMVFAGALAGFFPAMKAARIRPIDALRDE